MVLSSMAIFPSLEIRGGKEGCRVPGRVSAIAEIADGPDQASPPVEGESGYAAKAISEMTNRNL
ncbi:hypothetical protein [Thiocapsa marina]|uniref:hypothetical protein n=1 Tax=Thiocapsa marina TaxID=244573 RepID=UPI000308481A|nr:hypothetical protein [Thiocapsa marina]